MECNKNIFYIQKVKVSLLTWKKRIFWAEKQDKFDGLKELLQLLKNQWSMVAGIKE